MALAHLLADAAHGFGAERLHVPGGRDAGHVLREVAQERGTARRVHDFGVEHHGIEAPLLVRDDRERRVVARAEHMEARRQRGHAIAVAHPDIVARAERPHAVDKRGLSRHLDLGAAELALVRWLHAAAKLGDHGLLAVADAEHGTPIVNTRAGARGLPVSVTLAGPPESTTACGAWRSSAASAWLKGTTSQ